MKGQDSKSVRSRVSDDNLDIFEIDDINFDDIAMIPSFSIEEFDSGMGIGFAASGGNVGAAAQTQVAIAEASKKRERDEDADTVGDEVSDKHILEGSEDEHSSSSEDIPLGVLAEKLRQKEQEGVKAAEPEEEIKKQIAPKKITINFGDKKIVFEPSKNNKREREEDGLESGVQKPVAGSHTANVIDEREAESEKTKREKTSYDPNAKLPLIVQVGIKREDYPKLSSAALKKCMTVSIKKPIERE